MAFAVQRTVMVARIVIVLAVGAALGIERRPHLAHLGTQALQHVDDDMVVADQDALALNLRRQVPVTEMPGEPCEGGGAPAPPPHQLFLAPPYPHQPTLPHPPPHPR